MNNPESDNIKKEMELEDRDWIESIDDVYNDQGSERVIQLIDRLQVRAKSLGIQLPIASNTPFQNTISRKEQPAFPGDREIERRIKSINRWNAMAMVVRANRKSPGIGGHISTYASSATLFEVAFNHFLRAHNKQQAGDQIFFQGHASPGIYARAYLEGRLTGTDLENFRRELKPQGGLSSYPHPRLMPDFWEYPTVSMGLSSIMAIYQARFNQYLTDRGLIEKNNQKIWAFLGDGELDEPESLGAITLPPREKLDNLIFVVNCNLQRLDGPVRGNGKIIQELEAAFKGAGWNVIKVIWGGMIGTRFLLKIMMDFWPNGWIMFSMVNFKNILFPMVHISAKTFLANIRNLRSWLPIILMNNYVLFVVGDMTLKKYMPHIMLRLIIPAHLL